jgi:hypothetical protein
MKNGGSMEKTSRAIIALAALAFACLIGACAVKKAEWHPDSQGSGVWYDSGTKRIVSLRRSENGKDLFDMQRFSLDPREGRISYYRFRLSERDSYSCPDDDSLKLAISGPAFMFFGKNGEGKPFTEDYQAVDKVFLKKMAAEADSRRAKIESKKNQTLDEQQEAWILEMISQTLKELVLPE